MLKLSFLIVSLFVFLPSSWCIVRPAASCKSADVQSAVDAAQDGDTISVPRCVDSTDPTKTAFADWQSGVVITGKQIAIQGAGRDQSKLRLVAPNHFLFHIPVGNTKPVRISGFTFSAAPAFACDTNSAPYDCSAIRIAGGNQFIIYDNLFDGIHGGVPAAIYVIKGTYGLIHSNTFNNCYNSVYPYGSNDTAWSNPVTLGDEKAVYVEDNLFTHDVADHCAAIEGEEAAQYVFRYNFVNGCSGAGSHSVCQSGGRGTRRTEIYHNTIVQSGQNNWAGIYIMGGTGVIFQNLIQGAWERPILFDYKRSCEYGQCLGQYAVACNGNSALDGNRVTDYNGAAVPKNGWPCRDQIGLGTNQTQDAYYEWNNCTGNERCATDLSACGSCPYGQGIEVDPIVKSDQCPVLAQQIVAGRDYFFDTPRPGYVPYAYPHPLRGQPGSGVAPDPPSNLRSAS